MWWTNRLLKSDLINKEINIHIQVSWFADLILRVKYKL